MSSFLVGDDMFLLVLSSKGDFGNQQAGLVLLHRDESSSVRMFVSYLLAWGCGYEISRVSVNSPFRRIIGELMVLLESLLRPCCSIVFHLMLSHGEWTL